MLRIASILLAACIVGNENGGVRVSSAFSRFSIPGARSHPAVSSKTQLFTANIEDDTETDEKSSSSSMTTLNFVGKAALTTGPAPVKESKPLKDFFALPHTPQIILRGSKSNQVDELASIDDELLRKYEQACINSNALPPTPNDRFYNVTTPGLKFPGVQIFTVVTIGVKFLPDSDPGYELVLIRDEPVPRGNRLFVWFIKKVMGSSDEQSTFSLNRVTVAPKDGMVSFEANATLSLLFNFPSLLIKVLPGASKEKMEETGSAALQKAVEDDLPAALDELRNEYVRWLES